MAMSGRRAVGAWLLAILSVAGGWWTWAQANQDSPPAAEQPAPAPPQAKPSGDPPRSPLLRSLFDALDKLEDPDNQFGDREQLKNDLRKADGTLDRIRRENAQALAAANRQTPLGSQPNVIVIVADDLPREHLGCYGQQAIKTPNIDRLAAAGARFTQFRVGGAAVSGRWSLLTGGVAPAGQPLALQPGQMTVAQTLWRAGYATAWVGDCALDAANVVINPSDLGFEDWYGSVDAAAPYYPEAIQRRGKAVEVAENSAGKRGMHINDVYSQHASQWIRQRSGSRSLQRPFFLFVSYRVPAQGWQAPEADLYAQQSWSPTAKTWASLVSGVDRGVGSILAALRDTQQLGNTIVVVTADQRRAAAEGDQPFVVEGAAAEDPQAAAAGASLPLVIYGRGRIASALVADQPATLADLAPTLAGLASYSRGAPRFQGKAIDAAPKPVEPKVTDTKAPEKSAEKPAEKSAEGAAPVKPPRKLPQIIRGKP